MSLQSYKRVAAVAVVALVLAQLQSLGHRAAVRHVVCAEHGELVEAPELAKALDPYDTRSRLVEVTLGVDGDDDHCTLASGLRPYDVAAVADHAIAIAELADSAPPPLAGITYSLDYRIAPKTSPPLLALAA